MYDLHGVCPQYMCCVYTGRGRRGRGEEDEDGEDMHSRPSAPATLFDFLTNKIPSSKDGGKAWLGISRSKCSDRVSSLAI